jgi:hypothetical protein
MIAMSLPNHLGVLLAAEHRRDLEAVSARRRLLSLRAFGARRTRRAPRASR